MRILTVCIFALTATLVAAQQWIDTVYAIQTFSNIPYGTAPDFAGNQRTLRLDLSVPVDDQPPECGRPLMIVIHGGAFLAGRKDDPSPSRIRADFAKRGYASVSVQYRLGQFQTDQEIHCNASDFGLEWDCLNMTDSSEWYRAFYRGMQDVHGAIRFLANHADEYNLNPENVFVVGESAGGFIALGVGFIDDTSEVRTILTGQMPDAPLPNQIYETPCIQDLPYELDTSLASLALFRPDLGPYDGTLNQPAQTQITIRGVGNFFGAAFNNIFETHNGSPPALYLFHQPADLIVPFNTAGVLAGYAACATQFPFGCQWIINRPRVYGSNAIKSMLEDLASGGSDVPEYYADFTQNNASCAEQIFNPSLGGHAIDNYWLRMTNMATFFAEHMDSCNPVSTPTLQPSERFRVFPNPSRMSEAIIVSGPWSTGDMLSIHNMNGSIVFTSMTETDVAALTIPAQTLRSPGVYLLKILGSRGSEVCKIVVH